jgi:beta-lactamase class A
MLRKIFFVVATLACVSAVNESSAQPATPSSTNVLTALVADAVRAARAEFPKLKDDEIAVTLTDLRDVAKPASASYRGAAAIYPASVIKLFYLAAAHRWIEDARLADTPELRRALSDMIVHSYNEATHYVLDLLTGTTSGPELADDELKLWQDKRNSVNRYFGSLGYTGINANKKPWCEGPYGRETQAMKTFSPNRNLLTTDATARLMTEIVTDRCVSAKRCAEMRALLKRDPFAAKDRDADSQAKLTGAALPAGALLWSKAGWTSRTRHDAAYVELPNGAKFVLVVFTENHANDRGIIPAVARRVIGEMK